MAKDDTEKPRFACWATALRLVGLLLFAVSIAWTIYHDRSTQLVILLMCMLLWQIASAVEMRHLHGGQRSGPSESQLRTQVQQLLDLAQRDRNGAVRARLDRLTEAERAQVGASVLRAIHAALGGDTGADASDASIGAVIPNATPHAAPSATPTATTPAHGAASVVAPSAAIAVDAAPPLLAPMAPTASVSAASPPPFAAHAPATTHQALDEAPDFRASVTDKSATAEPTTETEKPLVGHQGDAR